MHEPGECAVFAVLYRRDRHGNLQILLVEDCDTRSRWKLPGGKSEAGETHYLTLARELHQELAIRVNMYSISRKAVYHAPLRTHTFIVYAIPYSRKFGSLQPKEGELIRSKWFILRETQGLLERGKILPHHHSAVDDFIADQEN